MIGLGNLATKQTELREQVKKFAQENVKPSLQEAITELQRVIPSLTAVRWTQYTPYFNDGEECTFSVNSPSFSFTDPLLKGSYADFDDERGDFYGVWGLREAGLSAPQLEALKTFSSNLTSVEEILKVAFGDHSQVILSATGIETEEYEHE